MTRPNTRFFHKHCNILVKAQMLLSKSKVKLLKNNFTLPDKKVLKNNFTLPDKKVFKMPFGMSTIILKWSHSPDLNIF